MRREFHFATRIERSPGDTQNDVRFESQASIIGQSLLQSIEMKRLIIALATISSVSLFAACGQSGPLYLPGDPSTLETQPPTPAEGEDEEKENSGAAKQPS